MPKYYVRHVAAPNKYEFAKKEMAIAKEDPRDPSSYDFGYRPHSYFERLDPKTVIVASILGEETSLPLFSSR